ncbi:MAG: tetratricopeptide repeat protein [Anditalea sp.]
MQFLTLLNKGNSLQKEDFQALVKLHETFPYFSIPKILAAKYELAKTRGESQELLHWASIQSPDRAWLKKLIEDNIGFLPPSTAAEPSGKAKAEEDQTENHNIQGPEDSAKEEEAAKTSFSRAEILRKLEDNLKRFKNPKKPVEKLDDPNLEPPGGPPKRSSAGEDLIETIKKKEKKVILDARKIEQNDIIKAFSKKKINLLAFRGNEDTDHLADLSEVSTVFNDKLVSESFAKLLIKQNKKDKAIEIYQKLILKFPDKTAYFADLIKKLED